MSRTTIIKISVSVICLIALVLLYVFGGRVIEDDDMVFEAGQADDIRDAFVFDPETLVYDGTGDIDFLEGVTLEGYNEEQLKSMVYIRISTGDSLSKKSSSTPLAQKKAVCAPCGTCSLGTTTAHQSCCRMRCRP